jgi:hypothetical protein
MAALVAGAAGELPRARAWLCLPALAWMLLLPVVAFRATARHYTRALGTARLERRRPPRTPPIGWVLWLLRRPADRVVVQLVEAHARFDWRFRAQVLALPVLLGGLVAGAAAGLPVRALFADPLHVTRFWHPAMLFVVVALAQPVLALPTLSRSAESGAAWILYTSTIPLPAFVHAARRLVRVLFIAPLLAIIAAGYLWAGAPLASIAVHLVTLALLGEYVARTMQRAFPHPPFSRPSDDEAVAQAFAVAAILVYVLCGIVAVVVVHGLYRGAASLLFRL